MTESATPAAPPNDLTLARAIRDGDEQAFEALVRREHGSMLRFARRFVSTQAVAEEVVQDAWLAVLQGIGRFEGRSSLRTWIFRILANLAKTRGQRESRSSPFSAFGDDEVPSVDPDRFLAAGERWGGHWAMTPASWEDIPEERLQARETLAALRSVIDTLPPMQAEVLQLRDVLGWSSAEVCNVLEISETNQRVLLHRARSKVRRALERLLGDEERA
ncbi:MAG: RNA polymerase sigma factor [Actinomycetota bacterium]